MRIAQVSPLYESVPPKQYGGTERVVSYLTEALVEKGHEVTLFASADSITSARLVPCCNQSLRTNSECVDPISHHLLMLEKLYQRENEFDIIHFHIGMLHYPLVRRSTMPSITTMHGRLDIKDFQTILSEFSEIPSISISKNQRLPVPDIKWVKTIYHGLPKGIYNYHEHPEEYLAFLGRIAPEKRVDRAIAIAIRTGMPIKIAAKIDKVDCDYYESEIKHLMDHPLVEFLGEIGESEKEDFLGNASALLFPIDWPEPFGLVMIEAMACGTPVVAYRNGSVPEIIDHGTTGFIVSSMDEAVQAVNQIGDIRRTDCRKIFEERFTDTIMAQKHLDLYWHLIGSNIHKQAREAKGCITSSKLAENIVSLPHQP